MAMTDFVVREAIVPSLAATTKEAVIREIVDSLRATGYVGSDMTEDVVRAILKREQLGSTGIGRGIAIPHCRSLVVSKLRVAFGRKPRGVDFKAIDEKPVNFFFLIVAPPLEVSNQYLPVLGKIAQFSKEADVPQRLLGLTEPVQFIELLKEKGV